MVVSLMFLFLARTGINTLMSKFVKYVLIKTLETGSESPWVEQSNKDGIDKNRLKIVVNSDENLNRSKFVERWRDFELSTTFTTFQCQEFRAKPTKQDLGTFWEFFSKLPTSAPILFISKPPRDCLNDICCWSLYENDKQTVSQYWLGLS